MPLLSLIIPVYNVEDYLQECLDSIVSQFDTSFEVIIVNDGSTDGSVQICKAYEENYAFIKLINQDNGGLSAARNTGLKFAKGNFVWFIDSDDYISKDSIAYLINKIQTEPKDIIRFNFTLFDDVTKEIEWWPDLTESSSTDSFSYFKKESFLMQVCFAVFRLDFLNQYSIRFKEGMVYEDVYFSLLCYSYNPSLAVFNNKLYFYRGRDGSLLRSSVTDKKVDSIIEILRLCDNLIAKNGVEKSFLAIRQKYDNIILFFDMLQHFPKPFRVLKMKEVNFSVPFLEEDTKGLLFMKGLLRVWPIALYNFRKKGRNLGSDI